MHFTTLKSLRPHRGSVWCAMSTHGLIGPIFFDGTVIIERYVKILKTGFISIIQSAPDFDYLLFLQDGAQFHRAKKKC